jgi:hypothetical protein
MAVAEAHLGIGRPMKLPFSHDAFLDLFAAYNAALWPAVVILWTLTAVWVLLWLRGRATSSRVAGGLLAVHWAWSGAAYHWGFFRTINPAAALFGLLFVVQAAVFVWLAATSRVRFAPGSPPRSLLGIGLIVWGLVYPFAGLAFGLEYPRMPVFAVPCPTTLFTAGLLLNSAGLPRLAGVIPLLWAIIGGSAASALGIRADLALVVAAVLLAIDAVAPAALGARPTLARR